MWAWVRHNHVMLTFSFLFSTQDSLPVFSPPVPQTPHSWGVCGQSAELISRREKGNGFIWTGLI